MIAQPVKKAEIVQILVHELLCCLLGFDGYFCSNIGQFSSFARIAAGIPFGCSLHFACTRFLHLLQIGTIAFGGIPFTSSSWHSAAIISNASFSVFVSFSIFHYLV